MTFLHLKHFVPQLAIREQQSTNIIMITFWSQFSVYALNSILVLFLTRPLIEHGLHYSQSKAYAFMGISQATGYLMPILGGYMADQVLGIRRSILIGSILLAMAYLLVMLSGLTIASRGDTLFLAAYALTPAANSLLVGTASGMISRIYGDDALKAKAAMTYYYLAINVGGLLAAFIAPTLLDSRYGPLSVLALTFVGKSIAALNFAYRYRIYDNIVIGSDKTSFAFHTKLKFIGYFIILYGFTLFAYWQIYIASIIISIGALAGLTWFAVNTLALSGEIRKKQLVACLLIIEAVIFFVIYNQMNSTLIIFASNNSDTHLLGFIVKPAQYQMLNPLLIIILGLQMPKFYQIFPKFSIPYQFASGTLLAGISLLILVLGTYFAKAGIVNGNYIALTYGFITIAELWVSAIGLSMIGLYCEPQELAFAMGVWYLACSLSSAISGRIASFVAIPETITSPINSLFIYQRYYLLLGLIACICSVFMFLFAKQLHRSFSQQRILLA